MISRPDTVEPRSDYGRNANGDVASTAVTRPGQPQQDLVSGVDWHPFGPPAAIEWAGGRLQLRELDAEVHPVKPADPVEIPDT